MKLLTVRNPWAALLAMGVKPIENRSRRTSYRGDVAIVAASNRVDSDERAEKAIRAHLERIDPYLLPRGGIVCVVELYDVVDKHPSWWFTGPYGWLVRNPRPIHPLISRKGQQGMVNAPPELLAVINERLNQL